MQETEAVKEAAKLIGIAIRTAPKSAGVDDISNKIASDSEKAASADEIRKIAAFLIKENKEAKTKKAIELDWHSDAEAIDKSDCLILLGVNGRKPLGFNCGGCGFKGCQEFMSAKPPETIFMAGALCMFYVLCFGFRYRRLKRCQDSGTF